MKRHLQPACSRFGIFPKSRWNISSLSALFFVPSSDRCGACARDLAFSEDGGNRDGCPLDGGMARRSWESAKTDVPIRPTRQNHDISFGLVYTGRRHYLLPLGRVFINFRGLIRSARQAVRRTAVRVQGRGPYDKQRQATAAKRWTRTESQGHCFTESDCCRRLATAARFAV